MEQTQTLIQVSANSQQVLDSRDVAKMLGKTHAHLVRDIDRYINDLDQNPKLDSDQFFIESSYQAGTGKMHNHISQQYIQNQLPHYV